MSKQNSQNRNNYSQAGRDRQSDPRLHEFDKAQFGQTRHQLKEETRLPGAAQKKGENG